MTSTIVVIELALYEQAKARYLRVLPRLRRKCGGMCFLTHVSTGKSALGKPDDSGGLKSAMEMFAAMHGQKTGMYFSVIIPKT